MPKNRPGRIHYVDAATKATNHGAACIEDGIAGVAVKQKQPTALQQGLPAAKQIIVGEPFAIIHKGDVEVPVGSLTVVKGTPIYIVPADNTLTTTATGNSKFGRVDDLPGQRGLPAGSMRVDLDSKDSF